MGNISTEMSVFSRDRHRLRRESRRLSTRTDGNYGNDTDDQLHVRDGDGGRGEVEV
jgi:hypothetical protein